MRRAGAAFALLVLAALMTTPAGAAAAADPDIPDGDDIQVTVPEGGVDGEAITNAQFRWGLNAEAGAGAFAGGCNFLSAGRAGDAGRGGVVWTESLGFYHASAGDVRIVKPSSTGEYDLATWAGRCLDPAGHPVSSASVTSTSGNQVIIDGGVGARADDGSLQINWTGSFTVVFYGGMTYWTATNPVLVLDANGNGRITAVASGYGASMEDLSVWTKLPERQIVLADIIGVDTGTDVGFAANPRYVGVAVSGAGQAVRDETNAAYWGSFPASFVDYQKLTGQAGYWLTTGGVRDKAKPATTLYISYDADSPISVAPPPTGSGSSATPRNVISTRPGGTVSNPSYPVPDSTTTMPQTDGLVPPIVSGFQDPVVLPLLGSAAALGLAILSVLNLMGALPWQRGV